MHQPALLDAETVRTFQKSLDNEVFRIQNSCDLLLGFHPGQKNLRLFNSIQCQPEAHHSVRQSAELPADFLMAHRLRDKRSVSHTVTRAGDGKMITADKVLDIFRNKRGLGNFLILDHIQQVKSAGLGYVYLGYWVKDSPKMAYKVLFRPLEVQRGPLGWVALP